ncbi:MAG TPA: alpha/beta fold hydrolase [Methylomirabilota bacterium]|nr:alpha/beta fold hydrolase [Methylomirabilota bacterium]
MGVAGERVAVAQTWGTLALVLHLPDTSARVPLIVACHGLSASKDSDKYLLLGAEVPAAGFALARFDFRGCGESSGHEGDTTIASRIDDVEAVLAHLAGHPHLDGRLGLLGSSLGGFVALFVAAGRPGTPVVTWNAPASLTELANDERSDNAALGVPFALEYMEGRYALAPKGVARHLVVHGDADDVVEMAHGAQLHEQAAEPCDFLVIPGGDHRLTDPVHRFKAVAASVAWFRRFLP